MKIKKKSIIILCIGEGLAMMLFAMFDLGVGYHAIDISFNVLRISYFYHLNYTSFGDMTLDGNTILPYDTVYRIGLIKVLSSPIFFLIGSLIFIFSLQRYISLKSGE